MTRSINEKAIAALIAARKNAGLTQRELAARIGKPQSFVAKIELRERNISLLEFIAVACALGGAPDEILKSAFIDFTAPIDL